MQFRLGTHSVNALKHSCNRAKMAGWKDYLTLKRKQTAVRGLRTCPKGPKYPAVKSVGLKLGIAIMVSVDSIYVASGYLVPEGCSLIQFEALGEWQLQTSHPLFNIGAGAEAGFSLEGPYRHRFEDSRILCVFWSFCMFLFFFLSVWLSVCMYVCMYVCNVVVNECIHACMHACL